MKIRTKIMLSVVVGAVATALTVGAIAVFNIKSVAAIAVIVSALFAELAVIGLYVANNITEPLNTIVDTVNEMNSGHLGFRHQLKRGDEIGAMAKALDAFADNLRVTTVGTMKKIAAGDLSADIELRDAKDEIRGAAKQAVESLREFIIDDGGKVLSAMANMDLSQRLTGVYSGEFANMKDNINAVVQNLNDTLGVATEATSRIPGAKFIEEMSRSIAEMSSMTMRNIDNTRQAKRLATAARIAAGDGDVVARRMAEAINRIKTSSDNTAKVVKVMGSIAFRVKLLAYNAISEATRAGNAGNGFAVVAEEMRTLAKLCADAVTDITDVVNESVKSTDDGVKLIAEAAKCMCRVFDSTSIVDNKIAEIAETSNEQVQDFEWVNAAVARIKEVAIAEPQSPNDRISQSADTTDDFAPSVSNIPYTDTIQHDRHRALTAKRQRYTPFSNIKAYMTAMPTFGTTTINTKNESTPEEREL